MLEATAEPGKWIVDFEQASSELKHNSIAY